MKVRIKEGALINQDCDMFAWPGCKPPIIEYVCRPYEYVTTEPNALFDAEPIHTDRLQCRRDGYGGHPYGSGCIYVKTGDVEIVE